MTIRFACACGQELAAREEYSGKKVRCTSCGEVVAVPAGGPARTTAAPGGMIRFFPSFSTSPCRYLMSRL